MYSATGLYRNYLHLLVAALPHKNSFHAFFRCGSTAKQTQKKWILVQLQWLTSCKSGSDPVCLAVAKSRGHPSLSFQIPFTVSPHNWPIRNTTVRAPLLFARSQICDSSISGYFWESEDSRNFSHFFTDPFGLCVTHGDGRRRVCGNFLRKFFINFPAHNGCSRGAKIEQGGGRPLRSEGKLYKSVQSWYVLRFETQESSDEVNRPSGLYDFNFDDLQSKLQRARPLHVWFSDISSIFRNLSRSDRSHLRKGLPPDRSRDHPAKFPVVFWREDSRWLVVERDHRHSLGRDRKQWRLCSAESGVRDELPEHQSLPWGSTTNQNFPRNFRRILT